MGRTKTLVNGASLHHVDDVHESKSSDANRGKDEEERDLGRATGSSNVATKMLRAGLEGEENGGETQDEIAEASNHKRLIITREIDQINDRVSIAACEILSP